MLVTGFLDTLHVLPIRMLTLHLANNLSKEFTSTCDTRSIASVNIRKIVVSRVAHLTELHDSTINDGLDALLEILDSDGTFRELLVSLDNLIFCYGTKTTLSLHQTVALLVTDRTHRL